MVDKVLTTIIVCVLLSNPGEIRQEYEAELEKQRNELAKKQEAEEKASEETIRQILETERPQIKNDDTLRMDEEFARRLAAGIDQPKPGCSQARTGVTNKGLIKNYLVPVEKKFLHEDKKACKREQTCSDSKANGATSRAHTSKIMFQSRRQKMCTHSFNSLTKGYHDRENSNRSDSGDSINQEMRYFKPIRTAPKSTFKSNHGTVVRAPLLKIPSMHPVPMCIEPIRAPIADNVAYIKPHMGSAFAPCLAPLHEQTSATCTSTTFNFDLLPVFPPSQPPMLHAQSNPNIKQYYNKKKSAMHVKPRSPNTTMSPLLGFSNDQKRVAVHVTDTGKSSQPVPHNTTNVVFTSPFPKASKETVLKPPKKKLLERSLQKANGCDSDNLTSVCSSVQAPPPVIVPPAPVPTPAEMRLQEQLDFEYAKRLHEELNNPRTRCMTLRASTMQNNTKRQVTLDELIPSKKFKI